MASDISKDLLSRLYERPAPDFDKKRRALVWFRRDLRDNDHAALHAALTSCGQVYCVFVFDTDILDPLQNLTAGVDQRVDFIHGCVTGLHHALKAMQGGLIVRHDSARKTIPALAKELKIDAVFANRDYEPDAIRRDHAVATALDKDDIPLFLSKDQTIFDHDEVLSQSDKPLTIFTPYKNAWLKKLGADTERFFLKPYPVERYADRLRPPPAAMPHAIPTLAQLGFKPSNLDELKIQVGMEGASALLEDFLPRIGRYRTARDFPAVKGPSYLSVHLRFGTISIRALARAADDAMRAQANDSDGAAVWLSELIWRDFYFAILYHFPHVAEKAFKPNYDHIKFIGGKEKEERLAAWQEGRTGYPLVDAAMAQINQTGYMHNRLRMVAACFLIKDLGVHWREGEAYFAQKLIDFDLSANNGGWQWAASSGCDAQPFFRIFNPVLQSEKFDPEGKFIKRYLPALSRLPAKWLHAPWKAPTEVLDDAGIQLGKTYPRPLVDHDDARRETLQRYQVVKKAGTTP